MRGFVDVPKEASRATEELSVSFPASGEGKPGFGPLSDIPDVDPPLDLGVVRLVGSTPIGAVNY